MSEHEFSRAARSANSPKGYFLFELIISVVMIAAIVVLAFPTYQDFSPEYHAPAEAIEVTSDESSADSPQAAESEAVSQETASSEHGAAAENETAPAAETTAS